MNYPRHVATNDLATKLDEQRPHHAQRERLGHALAHGPRSEWRAVGAARTPTGRSGPRAHMPTHQMGLRDQTGPGPMYG